MKKICVMHMASIGDTLLASPVYRAIKKHYPKVKLVAVVSYAGEELFRGNPYIDELIPYRKGDSILKVIKAIWRSDAALIMDYHYRNALYAFIAMIPQRIGRGKDFINIRIKDELRMEYEPLNYLRLAKEIGADSDDTRLTPIVTTDEEKRHVDELLASHGLVRKKFVTIVPYSLMSIKDWEPAKYREIIKRLKEHGYEAVILGGENERERIAKEFPREVSFAGITNLRESAEIISRAKAQLSGCTAMLHVCATTDTPVVALYGPSAPQRWAPRSKCYVVSHNLSCAPCLPCYNTEFVCSDNNRCISEIEVDEVYVKLLEALGL